MNQSSNITSPISALYNEPDAMCSFVPVPAGSSQAVDAQKERKRKQKNRLLLFRYQLVVLPLVRCPAIVEFCSLYES